MFEYCLGGGTHRNSGVL